MYYLDVNNYTIVEASYRLRSINSILSYYRRCNREQYYDRFVVVQLDNLWVFSAQKDDLEKLAIMLNELKPTQEVMKQTIIDCIKIICTIY